MNSNENSRLEQKTFLCQYARKEYKIDLNCAFIVQCRHVVFYQVEVHHLYRPKNRNNSLIREQKSNKHIADGHKKFFRAFKRETVKFLVAKNLALSHLPRKALPTVQTFKLQTRPEDRGHVTNLMLKVSSEQILSIWNCSPCRPNNT